MPESIREEIAEIKEEIAIAEALSNGTLAGRVATLERQVSYQELRFSELRSQVLRALREKVGIEV